MVSEATNNNAGSTIAGYAMFPTVTALGSSAIALKAHGKNVIKSQHNEAFRALDKKLADAGADSFTRSQALANAYDTYKDIAKKNARAQKAFNQAAKKGKISLRQRFMNLFRNEQNKVTVKTLENTANEAKKQLNIANEALANVDIKKGSKTIDELENILDLKDGKKFFTNIADIAGKEAGESALKGAWKYTKNNFKNELGWKNGKFNYFMTALQFVPNIFQKVIPAFKNEGAKEGMKEIGKTCAQAGADLVAYSAGGAVGRTIGAFLGRLVTRGSGVGAKVGAQIGDMIGSMVVGSTVCNAVDKVIGANKDEATTNNQQINPETLPTQAQHKLSYKA